MRAKLGGVALLAGCVVTAFSCTSDPRKPCYFNRDCPAGERCSQGGCEATGDAGAGGGGASANGGGAGGGSECSSTATRRCNGGCGNIQTCANGTWGPCVAACPAGQECVSDACRCTPASCAGCCAGDACRPGGLDNECGASGSDCAACPSGQRCDGGACDSCNATTCSTGCCTGPTCNAPTAMRCGTSGNVCFACEVGRADTCDGGTCRCGALAQCAVGQHCVAGTCVCTPASCPTGCCQGTSCTTPVFPTCGDGGTACVACSTQTSNTCRPNGQCGCGAGTACLPNQQCVNGACRCTATSCASGCCAGDTCVSPTLPTVCGAAGGACMACDGLRANVCDGGICGCGSGAECVAGQRCLNGACVCDVTSCANGCCKNGLCYVGATSACGTDGGNCTDCTSSRGNLCLQGVCHCGTVNPTCQAAPCAPAACNTTSASSCVSDTAGNRGCDCQDFSGPYLCGARADGCYDDQGIPVCGCGGVASCGIGTRCAHCRDPSGTCRPTCLANDAGCLGCNLP